MKKLLSFMLIAMSVLMLSSCIIVATEEDHTNYYDITCHNKSDTYIEDWCVVRNEKVTYAKKKNDYCYIAPGNEATLKDLPEGEYILYVAFVRNPDYDRGDYIESKKFKLNKDYEVYVDQTFVDEYLHR